MICKTNEFTIYQSLKRCCSSDLSFVHYMEVIIFQLQNVKYFRWCLLYICQLLRDKIVYKDVQARIISDLDKPTDAFFDWNSKAGEV